MMKDISDDGELLLTAKLISMLTNNVSRECYLTSHYSPIAPSSSLLHRKYLSDSYAVNTLEIPGNSCVRQIVKNMSVCDRKYPKSETSRYV